MSICPDTYGDILHSKKKPIVRLLAIAVGNMGVYTSEAVELEKIRREVFGAAGRYRFPTYAGNIPGIEYRSLSSEWTRTLESVEAIYTAARFALSLFLEEEKEALSLIKHYLGKTTEAVANVDRALSEKILSELNLL